MFRRPEGALGSSARPAGERKGVIVAGPGSSTTIPGIIVSEIVLALAQSAPVTRVEVDLGLDFTVGLHRAPSLAIAHGAIESAGIIRHRAPDSARFRAQAFRDWLGPDIGIAIAYAWPGIDNGWIKQYLQIAKGAGVATIVACASLPKAKHTRAVALADTISRADLVLVGDEADAAALISAFGSSRPTVEVHRALSLGNRVGRSTVHRITAFLPRDSTSTLCTLLAAFDAIPEAWIHGYQLQVVMRHTGGVLPQMIANSYHADHVRLISGDLSTPGIEELCAESSILSVADPPFDSRAFSTAMDCGIATVVLSTASIPDVGRGYVGGLIADLSHPASVHVALLHALRLQELGFPSPDAWEEFALRVHGPAPARVEVHRLLEPAVQAR